MYPIKSKFTMFAAVIAFLFSAVSIANSAHAVKIEEIKTASGLTAWLVRDHTNPIISIRFQFKGGSALDLNGKEGLASVASALLDEGAGKWDSRAFQRQMEDLSVKLSFSANRDSFGGRLRTLRKNRAAAFDLLKDALTNPRFDEEPIARIRSQTIANLRQRSEDPGTVAGQTLMKALFPTHPYGRPNSGTVESVKKITRRDLTTFVKQRLAQNNLIVGIVGDISKEEVADFLSKTFSELPQKAAPWNLPEVIPTAEGKTIVVNKSVPQSSVMFAHHGFKRDDPDFLTAYVVNHIFGAGSFTSRLYQNIREKRGLVYSINTYLRPLDSTSLVAGNGGTANARVGETVSILRKEWNRIAKDGVTETELSEAKTFLTGSFPLRFTRSGRIAAMLVGMQLWDRGIDYFDRRNALVEAVTLKDANRVAKRLLGGNKLTVVVVGQPKGLKSLQ
jgi:zinc protease